MHAEEDLNRIGDSLEGNSWWESWMQFSAPVAVFTVLLGWMTVAAMASGVFLVGLVRWSFSKSLEEGLQFWGSMGLLLGLFIGLVALLG
jgi:hypothetical protein